MTHDHLRPLLESPKDLHLLTSLRRVKRSGARHQIGTDDSSPEGRRRRARRCGRRSRQESHGQDDRPAVGPSGEGRHSSLPICTVDQIRMRVRCTCTSSPYDSISRRAMLDIVAGGRQALPFARLLHSEPSAYLQGQYTEVNKGDPLMPLLFSLGQHASLEALQRRMRPTERLLAYHDDIYLASKPERVGDVVAATVQELWAHARIRVHGSKTHIWNRAGTKPQVCEVLQRQAEETDPEARVWQCCGLLWVTKTSSADIRNGPGRSTENS